MSEACPTCGAEILRVRDHNGMEATVTKDRRPRIGGGGLILGRFNVVYFVPNISADREKYEWHDLDTSMMGSDRRLYLVPNIRCGKFVRPIPDVMTCPLRFPDYN